MIEEPKLKTLEVLVSEALVTVAARGKKRDARDDGSANPDEPSKRVKPRTVEETGTERTASKCHLQVKISNLTNPKAKRIREYGSTGMSDIQNIEVCEFYPVPRIAPRTVGKYINKSASFAINTTDCKVAPWDFTKAERRKKTR